MVNEDICWSANNLFSLILKLVRPINKLRKRWLWVRGKRYLAMKKLDPVKVRWIINAKENNMKNKDIANVMHISIRWIQKLYSRYKNHNIVELKKPGRPKKSIDNNHIDIIIKAYNEYRSGAISLEKIIDNKYNIHMLIILYIKY